MLIVKRRCRKNLSPWLLAVLVFIGIVMFIIMESQVDPRLAKERIGVLDTHLQETLEQRSIVTSKTMSTTKARVPCRDHFKQSFNRQKKYICSNTYGGIGNFMFAFASVYGMASSVNKTVLIHKKNPVTTFFRVKAKIVDDLCICKNAKFVFERKHCGFSKELLNLSEHTNYRPGHYFQSWKYFEHVADDIRKQFTFRDDLLQKAVRKIKNKVHAYLRRSLNSVRNNGNVTSQTVVTVGVHVRKGDIMRSHRLLKYGYMVAPLQYFKNAMAHFRKKYESVLFLVCSDDIKWCKENIAGSDVMYMEDNPFDIDLAILSQCNNSIISVGTFGWWGAFLASGETIYYKYPARNGSRFRKRFSDDLTDYFYPGWIGME